MERITELQEILCELIKQNQALIPASDEWENESKNANINYAAGYKAALEFCENQLHRIQTGQDLHHLEEEHNRQKQRRPLDIEEIANEIYQSNEDDRIEREYGPNY